MHATVALGTVLPQTYTSVVLPRFYRNTSPFVLWLYRNALPWCCGSTAVNVYTHILSEGWELCSLKGATKQAATRSCHLEKSPLCGGCFPWRATPSSRRGSFEGKNHRRCPSGPTPTAGSSHGTRDSNDRSISFDVRRPECNRATKKASHSRSDV